MVVKEKSAQKWQLAVDCHFVQVQNRMDSMPGKQKVWATMLYGSQNYGTAIESSDVDTRSMILPNLYTVVKGIRPINTGIKMVDGSLDSVKDFREMFSTYLKVHIGFLETLYTPYYAVMGGEYQKFFQELRDHRDLIANSNLKSTIHTAVHMAEDKYRDFNKYSIEKEEVLGQYGYDPKQLHNQVRLYHFISTLLETQDFETALLSCHPSVNPELNDKVIRLRINPFPYDEASVLRQEMMTKTSQLGEQASRTVFKGSGFEEAREFLDDLSYRIVCYILRQELEDAADG